MAQLSRPYQIALGAMAVLALVWFVALRGHSGASGAGSGEPASSGPSPSQSAQAGGPQSASTGTSGAGSSHIYHGPTPGLEGLSRDVAKAHGAVSTSQHNAEALQRSSQQASGESSTSAGATRGAGHASPATHSGSSAVRGGPSSSASKHQTSSHTRGGSAHGTSGNTHTSASSGSGGRAPQQVQVEREISQGKTVMILFWEPRSTVDNAVRSQALALGKGSKGKVVVHLALTDQVGLFGPVTEVAHVYQTPTILIVGRHGLVSTLTGLVDKFTLQQAVREAEQANR